jgi:hypothetical protein
VKDINNNSGWFRRDRQQHNFHDLKFNEERGSVDESRASKSPEEFYEIVDEGRC